MRKFCPKCGATIKQGVFCKDCKEEKLDYREINIKLCPSKKVFFKGKWTPFHGLRKLTENLLKESTSEPVKLLEGLEVYDGLLQKPGLKKKLEVSLEHRGEAYVLPIYVEVTYSPGIGKLGSTYFEGILQVRNANDDVKKYISNFIRKNPKILINKVVDKQKRMDMYFIDKHYINLVAQKIIRNFSGYMTNNPTLFSHDKQRSKDLYRLNVLLYIPDFRVGDVVAFKDDILLVKKTSKEISGFSLKKKKHTSIVYNQRNHESFKMIEKVKTTVSRIMPELYIINPETYQESKAHNPLNFKHKPGQKVRVVSFQRKFFVVQ